MAGERERKRQSPVVLLSLCLSLFAVAVSLMALLMVYDRTPPQPVNRESLGVRQAEWDWRPRIERVESRLKRIGERIAGGTATEEDRRSVEDELHSVSAELQAWLKAADSRARDLVARMAEQVGEVRIALDERSEQATEKLERLRESLRDFRERVGEQESRDQPDATVTPTPAP